jgi:hypothetical protein
VSGYINKKVHCIEIPRSSLRGIFKNLCRQSVLLRSPAEKNPGLFLFRCSIINT